MTVGPRSTRAAAKPATPLSHVPIGTKTGGFASPPHDGYALSIAIPVSAARRAYAMCLPHRTSVNGDLEVIQIMLPRTSLLAR